jgi:hypothetical protein
VGGCGLIHTARLPLEQPRRHSFDEKRGRGRQAFARAHAGLDPELGSVSLLELASVRGRLNLPVERDLYFTATRRCPPTLTRPGCMARSKPRGGRAMTTNITADHQAVFEALSSGDYRNFALFSCFAKGEPAAAIVAVNRDGDGYTITPLFVSITPTGATQPIVSK